MLLPNDMLEKSNVLLVAEDWSTLEILLTSRVAELSLLMERERGLFRLKESLLS